MQFNGIVWALLVAAGAVALAVIVRTKWLQSHTLRKCVLLSVVLHAVVAVVCTCLGGRSPASWGTHEAGRMTMLVVAAEEPSEVLTLNDTAELDQFPLPEARLLSTDAVSDAASTDTASTDTAMAVAGPLDGDRVAAGEPAQVSAAPPADHVPLLEVAGDEGRREETEAGQDAEPEQAKEEAMPVAAAGSSLPATDASPALPSAGAVPAASAAAAVPAVYADRMTGRRASAAAARGGSQETERAVQAALAWLAAAQSSDGRWSAVRHGGGVERSVPGHHRHAAGAHSDHGVTGLALLAFLGAGNTHREGGFSETVARGLRFLTEHQRADGSLAGDAEFFAALYCHGMAAIAVAECCGMTGDKTLQSPLQKAVRYTLSMQSPSTGGWRYAAGDKGDTSQLGWQVMLLSSARHAGMVGLERAESRAGVFLQSVSSGRAGGLAAYRPGERPSVVMTAEALASRLFLGMPTDHPCVAEAVDLLARTPPDSRSPNAYAWYYSTLASFHAGGPQWEAWNSQLQAALLPLQRRGVSGLDGSWDPDPVWGGHGGRVYSTAMAAMTLEVYYRHLPMHRLALPIAGVPGQSPR